MYPGKLWDYESIACNPNTTREYILDHYLAAGSLNMEIDLYQRLMAFISMNRNITAEDILKYPDLAWDTVHLLKYANITPDEVFTLLELGIRGFGGCTREMALYDYSSNSLLTREMIRTYGEWVWDWEFITARPWITVEHILANEQRQRGLVGFARNPNLTMNVVLRNHVIYEQSQDVSMNPGITWEIITDYPDYPWDWRYVSRNPNITLEIVLDNPDIKWDWFELSANINITWEMIKDNPDLPWDKDNVSENPNITWDIVRDNPEWPWKWAGLSANKFSKYSRNSIEFF